MTLKEIEQYAKQQAIAFALWLNKNCKQGQNKINWIYNMYSDEKYAAVYTTDELYELFLKTKQSLNEGWGINTNCRNTATRLPSIE